MRAEELLETLTDDDLKKRANDCFAQAEAISLAQQGGPEEKNRLVAEADLYLKAIARREDARVAARDFRLEIWVIVLIGIEIVLSVVGLIAGYQQGRILDKQTTALTHMDASSAATKSAIEAARDSLKSLAADQQRSLERLNEMNENLQGSLRTTRTMASSTGKQLAILQAEQAERLAQLARKPKIVLYIGNVRLDTPLQPIQPAEQTDTSITYDLLLTNEGNLTAHKLTLRLQCPLKSINPSISSLPMAEVFLPPSDPTRVFVTTTQADVRPKQTFPFRLTLSHPKDHAPYQVSFTVDADEIDTATYVGSILVR